MMSDCEVDVGPVTLSDEENEEIVEILDISLMTPVLQSLQTALPILITPLSELKRTNDYEMSSPSIGGGKKAAYNDNISPLELRNQLIRDITKEVRVYNGPARKLWKQAKITDYIKTGTHSTSKNEGEVSCNKESLSSFEIDLPSSTINDLQIQESSYAYGEIDVDFGRLEQPELYTQIVSPSLLGNKMHMKMASWKDLDKECETTHHTGEIYQLPMAENINNRIPNEFQHNNAGNKETDDHESTHLVEIRDLLLDIKDLMTVMVGYLMKKEQLPSNDKSNESTNSHDSPVLGSDETEDNNLTPNTRKKIANLSLEELLLCANPKHITQMDNNPLILRNKEIESSSPSPCVINDNLNRSLEDTGRVTLDSSSSKGSKIAGKSRTKRKTKQTKGRIKENTRKNVNLLRGKRKRAKKGTNFGSLFKLLDRGDSSCPAYKQTGEIPIVGENQNENMRNPHHKKEVPKTQRGEVIKESNQVRKDKQVAGEKALKETAIQMGKLASRKIGGSHEKSVFNLLPDTYTLIRIQFYAEV